MSMDNDDHSPLYILHMLYSASFEEALANYIPYRFYF